MSNVLFVTPQQYFAELLKEACSHNKIIIPEHNEFYILNLLNYYIDSKNLYRPFLDDQAEKPPETFAELYLTALSLEEPKNKEFMKILADRALYLSGFFGDSLQKQTVDLEYYMSIGSSAYSNLATWTKEDTLADVYDMLSKKFIHYVNLLSYISEKSSIQTNHDILKLYERYLQTGSSLAKQKLNQLGVITEPDQLTKEALKIKKI